MALSFGAQGTTIAGTTSIDVPYPAGITAGQMLVLFVGTKYDPNPPATPSGWTLGASSAGGSGSSGVDTGVGDVRQYYKIADGTESGTVNLANASANVMVGRMARFTKGATKNWGVSTGFGNQNSANQNWSVSTTLTDVDNGDLVFSTCFVNSNVSSFSAEAITATGLTLGTETERTDFQSAMGDDMSLVAVSHPVTGGPATSAVTYAMTSSNPATTDQPAGAVVLIRFRELDAFTIDPSGIASAEAFGTPHVAHAIDCSAIASAEAFGTTVIGLVLDPAGVASAEAFGDPALSHELGISGIASLEAFGTTVMDQAIYPAGVASEEAFGATEVAEVQSILPTGIQTEEAFGAPSMELWIQPVGIASAEVFGTPSLALGAIDVETLYDVGYEKNFTATATFERNWSATVEAAGDASFTAEVD